MSQRWLPGRDQVLNNRWVRPFARHLNNDRLWHFDCEPVARGAAVGVFFGLMLPIAQFVFAILSAIMVRGNVPTAAACTLITNPLTFPPIYWLAYQLGSWLTDANDGTPQTLRPPCPWRRPQPMSDGCHRWWTGR